MVDSTNQLRLPPELIDTIDLPFEDLLSCCLVSRAFSEIFLPKVHNKLTLSTYGDDHRAFTSVQDMLDRATEFSSYMRSCVKQLEFRIADEPVLAFTTFTEILDLFSNVKAVNYTSAGRLPVLDNEVPDTPQATPRSHTPVDNAPSRNRQTLSTLCLHCDTNGLKFDRRHRNIRASFFPMPANKTSSVPTLFHFLTLFQEIDVLDLTFLSLGEDTTTPDPDLITQLPRIHTLIKRYETGTLGHDATSLICQYLNPHLPISIEDKTSTFNFLTVDSNCQYPNITHLSGIFGLRDASFRISSSQFPALVAINLKTSIRFRTSSDTSQNPNGKWSTNPLQTLADGLHDAPASLRDITLTLDMGHNFQLFSHFRFDVDREVVPRIKGLDWEALSSLFDVVQTGTRRIVFTMGYQATIVRKVEGQEVVVSSEQLRDALSREIPLLGSDDVQLEVDLSAYHYP